MTKRNTEAKDPISSFANAAVDDLQFPKQSIDFDELSHYLELNADYLDSMAVFDEVYREYSEIEGRG